MEIFYDVGIERKNGEVLLQSLADYDQHKLRKGEFIPSEPFEMEISEGRKLFDIVGFQDTSNFAISSHLHSLLEMNGITGWRGYEIRIRGKNEKYFGFQVTGRCGKLVEPNEPGFYIGYRFDHTSWDGSDFFNPSNTSILFCTQKARDLIIKNKITNIELVDINTFRHYSIGSS